MKCLSVEATGEKGSPINTVICITRCKTVLLMLLVHVFGSQRTPIENIHGEPCSSHTPKQMFILQR